MTDFEFIFSDPEAFALIPVYQVLSRVFLDRNLEFTESFFTELAEHVTSTFYITKVLAQIKSDPGLVERTLMGGHLPSSHEELVQLLHDREQSMSAAPDCTERRVDPPHVCLEDLKFEDDSDVLEIIPSRIRTRSPSPVELRPTSPTYDPNAVVRPCYDDEFPCRTYTQEELNSAVDELVKYFNPDSVSRGDDIQAAFEELTPFPSHSSEKAGKIVVQYEQCNTKVSSILRREEKYSSPKFREFMKAQPKTTRSDCQQVSSVGQLVSIYSKLRPEVFARTGIHHVDAILSWKKMPRIVASAHKNITMNGILKIGVLAPKHSYMKFHHCSESEYRLEREWMEEHLDYVFHTTDLLEVRSFFTGAGDVGT